MGYVLLKFSYKVFWSHSKVFFREEPNISCRLWNDWQATFRLSVFGIDSHIYLQVWVLKFPVHKKYCLPEVEAVFYSWLLPASILTVTKVISAPNGRKLMKAALNCVFITFQIVKIENGINFTKTTIYHKNVFTLA